MALRRARGCAGAQTQVRWVSRVRPGRRLGSVELPAFGKIARDLRRGRSAGKVALPFFSFPDRVLEEGLQELSSTKGGCKRKVGLRCFVQAVQELRVAEPTPLSWLASALRTTVPLGGEDTAARCLGGAATCLDAQGSAPPLRCPMVSNAPLC